MTIRNTLHLLIIGSPRSGTTLLSSMLSCHPDITILHEDLSGAAFRILSKRVKGIKLCIPNQIEIKHNQYEKMKSLTSYYFYMTINYALTKLGRERIPITIEKKSSLSIRDYEKRANNLHILGIIRDPDSVVTSIMKRGGKSRKIAEYRWQRSIEILHQLSIERPNESISIITFDDLVTKPKSTMQKILTRIDSVYDNIVLEGYMYTPQYKGRLKINNEKASMSLEHALNYPLLKKNEIIKEKYLYLIARARAQD